MTQESKDFAYEYINLCKKYHRFMGFRVPGYEKIGAIGAIEIGTIPLDFDFTQLDKLYRSIFKEIEENQ